jgi:Ni,Fe-hydrogenase I large subunit
VRAVENALRITIPDNGRLVRNLVHGIQYVQDHSMHFYHLHGLDWVDLLKALEADPGKTAALAQSLSDWPGNSKPHFHAVQQRLRTFVESGQLGLFANAYWGHPAYQLTPEANLMVVAHYLEALDWQRDIIRMHAVLGGKNPHMQNFLVGGTALPINPDSPTAFNAGDLALLQQLAKRAQEFVEKVYLPDLMAVAGFYKDWASIGSGVGNYLACGEFPTDTSGDPEKLFLPHGVVLKKDLGRAISFDHEKVSEYITRSWYDYSDGNDKPKHPWQGETRPHYTGPQPPFQFLDTSSKYSWLKAPRYDHLAVEVGPLARMLVAYAKGHPRIHTLLSNLLAKLDLGPEALFSTLGRTAARGIETLVVAEQLPVWLGGLAENMKHRDFAIHNGDRWDPDTWPKEAQGCGLEEAPRGALGHWVHIHDGTIAQYQCVVPTTWNCSPRDGEGVRGACEEALLGTPVADPQRPLEILRTVHSFDPCMACAVHLVDKQKRELLRVRVA